MMLIFTEFSLLDVDLRCHYTKFKAIKYPVIHSRAQFYKIYKDCGGYRHNTRTSRSLLLR